jgi:hypothetical protein
MLVSTPSGVLKAYSLTATPATLLATALTFGTGGAPAIGNSIRGRMAARRATPS